MSRFDNLDLAWRYAIKEAIWLLGRHRPGPSRDICLFSTRRGGSTWLMELMAVNRGVRYLDQPLSLHHPAPGHIRRLPIPNQSQFTSLTEDEEPRVRAFIEDLFSGRLQVNAPWELWHPTFHWTTHRVVLKIIDAKPLIDWFDRTFDVHIVYSIRHPLPSSLSVIRNGWALTAQAYLRDPDFTTRWLDTDQIDFAWDVLRTGTPLQQHVLNWALENLAPLRLLPERPHWLYVSYEHATLDPEGIVHFLANHLNLADHDRMMKQVRAASRSTRKLDSTYDPTHAAQAQLGAWRKHVSDAEEKTAFMILDHLDISAYQMGSNVPTLAHPTAPISSRR